MKQKCICLLSGGLDSLLSVKVMKNMNYDVLTLYFKLPFSKDSSKRIKKFCKLEKVKLQIIDCTKGKMFQEYLEVIRKPKHRRGTGLNPCVDCKIFILNQARKIADKKMINTIATGEVEGQRPMSQQKHQLKKIEEEAKLTGRLIRPLTLFYEIRGRQRNRQIELAKEFEIEYPGPAGGCLLCEKFYCEKLKKILNKNITLKDIEMLKIGRHFENSEIILGRNEKEDIILEKEKGIKIIPLQSGATALIKDKRFEAKAKELIRKYSKHKIKEFEVRG